jgi:hypothetical protein
MAKKLIPVMLLMLGITLLSFKKALFSYDSKLVEVKTLQIDNPKLNKKEPYAIVKMSRKGERVKVKYFAAKNGTLLVGDRFNTWKSNKNIISVSSGTYMNSCTVSQATPVGLCIDAGNEVNRQLTNQLDGLIIVYATGGMVATNLKQGDLTVTYSSTGQKKTLDIRNNSFDMTTFMDWAKKEEATVFQAHLFVYKDELRIGTNSSQTAASRRFLAVCKEEDGSIAHYLINLPTACTLYDGVIKAKNYLKNVEDVSQIVYMINVDTGCQNIFSVNNSDGSLFNSANFKGELDIMSAANLLCYYYE